MNVEKSLQYVAMDAEESIEDAKEPTQDDTVPKPDASANEDAMDKSKWFKQDVVERLETPDPDWFKEPNVNNAPGQNYKKDKLTKADLEGPAFALLKGNYKNNIELEYNMEQCYLALTDQID
ncbi:hypothetical protein Tco_1106323 [Tanacetum coccineum]